MQENRTTPPTATTFMNTPYGIVNVQKPVLPSATEERESRRDTAALGFWAYDIDMRKLCLFFTHLWQNTHSGTPLLLMGVEIGRWRLASDVIDQWRQLTAEEMASRGDRLPSRQNLLDFAHIMAMLGTPFEPWPAVIPIDAAAISAARAAIGLGVTDRETICSLAEEAMARDRELSTEEAKR